MVALRQTVNLLHQKLRAFESLTPYKVLAGILIAQMLVLNAHCRLYALLVVT